MLAQVKKLVSVGAGGDIAGRFGAWWDGKDYVPPVPGEEGANDAEKTDEKADKKSGKKSKAEDKPEGEAPEAKAQEAKAQEAKAQEAKAEAKVEAKPEPELKPEPQPEPEAPAEVVEAAAPVVESADACAMRLQALETLWGEGRFAPGSTELDTRLLDAVLENADKPGDIGFIGADGALLGAFASRSDRLGVAAEWRGGCVARLQDLAPKAVVSACDIDRPKCFPDHALEGLVSIEAFAYSDHKAGLVSRAHRSLSDTGRWVFLDTTRTTNKTPPEAFASAWAEPQLTTSDEIEELLTLAGFRSVRKIAATETVLDAARAGYAHLSSVLEAAATNGLAGREGALFLQELAWEAQSWRARIRALEGGALEVNIWIADKTETLELTREAQEAVLDEILELAVTPDDAGASEALFDKA
jgi:hypothetical protein